MKRLAVVVTLLLTLSVTAGAGFYLTSRRAFLNDLNNGVRAYLTGHFQEAQRSLAQAHERRPNHAEVRSLLVKVLTEQMIAAYRRGDSAAGEEALARALTFTHPKEDAYEALLALDRKLARAEKRPQSIEEVLHALSRQARDNGSQGVSRYLDQWSAEFRQTQDQQMKRFWQRQEDWLTHLEHARRSFQWALGVSLLLVAACFGFFTWVWSRVLNAYFGRRGLVIQLLEDHYHRMVAALPAGSVPLMGPPPSHRVSSESKKIDAIEAELVERPNPEEAGRLLKSFLEGEDPWVCARAAKVLYAFDASLALSELKRLITQKTLARQWPGIWALTELGSTEALDLLKPLLESPNREVQQAVVRSLVQLQGRESLSPQARAAVAQMLEHVREGTDWII